MTDIIVILFVLALIFISTAGREFETDAVYDAWLERTELRNEGLSFEEGMRKIDSLWQEIKWTH